MFVKKPEKERKCEEKFVRNCGFSVKLPVMLIYEWTVTETFWSLKQTRLCTIQTTKVSMTNSLQTLLKPSLSRPSWAMISSQILCFAMAYTAVGQSGLTIIGFVCRQDSNHINLKEYHLVAKGCHDRSSLLRILWTAKFAIFLRKSSRLTDDATHKVYVSLRRGLAIISKKNQGMFYEDFVQNVFCILCCSRIALRWRLEFTENPTKQAVGEKIQPFGRSKHVSNDLFTYSTVWEWRNVATESNSSIFICFKPC